MFAHKPLKSRATESQPGNMHFYFPMHPGTREAIPFVFRAWPVLTLRVHAIQGKLTSAVRTRAENKGLEPTPERCSLHKDTAVNKKTDVPVPVKQSKKGLPYSASLKRITGICQR